MLRRTMIAIDGVFSSVFCVLIFNVISLEGSGFGNVLIAARKSSIIFSENGMIKKNIISSDSL